ncbi:hypothetical protein METHB2_160004 [Candidatus Methylobacter favarea]|uniref:Uncharacterized protein n=1 Tax=Candidatus Methylobacter favarea TaxID=2707345 RepID=A0A8S0X7C5_9GAMM|nr:hypothetical protein [Candidatus Methylobacter favarea]CAA9889937.1 hypothetical protein METHB2_160004 [Candidatus Methylobacter favarea]
MIYSNKPVSEIEKKLIAARNYSVREKAGSNMNSNPDNSGTSNFKIAHNAEKAKTQLVSALSPTALGLPYAYEQNRYIAGQTNASLLSEWTTSINYYFSASRPAYQSGTNNDEYNNKKHNPVTALQYLLFYFEHFWLTSRQQLAAAKSEWRLLIGSQHKSGFSDVNDLGQEGQTGLLKTIGRLHYPLGFHFFTYAESKL